VDYGGKRREVCVSFVRDEEEEEVVGGVDVLLMYNSATKPALLE